MSDDKPNNAEPEPIATGRLPPAADEMPVLPYATPAKFLGGVRRDGKFIVLPHGVNLPACCVKCGKPTPVNVPLTFNLIWPRRQISINVGLCWDHSRRHSRKLRRGKAICLLAVGMLYLFAFIQRLVHPNPRWLDTVELNLLVAGLLLVGGIWTSVLGQPLQSGKSTARALWLRGANESFLNQLPSIDADIEPIVKRETP